MPWWMSWVLWDETSGLRCFFMLQPDIFWVVASMCIYIYINLNSRDYIYIYMSVYIKIMICVYIYINLLYVYIQWVTGWLEWLKNSTEEHQDPLMSKWDQSEPSMDGAVACICTLLWWTGTGHLTYPVFFALWFIHFCSRAWQIQNKSIHAYKHISYTVCFYCPAGNGTLVNGKGLLWEHDFTKRNLQKKALWFRMY